MGRWLVYLLIKYPVLSMVTLWALYYVVLGAICGGILVYVRRQLRREDDRWSLNGRANVAPKYRERVYAGGHVVRPVERRDTLRLPLEPRDLRVSSEIESMYDWRPQVAGSNVEHFLLSR